MNKYISNTVVTLFVLLFVVVSFISTLHSYEFFKLSNVAWMSILLATAFEIGQLATLGSIVVPDKLDMRIVWPLFIMLTLFQIMGNVYFSYINLDPINYKKWIELFGFSEYTEIAQKRIVAIVEGAFLPLLSIGFSKSLVDYLKTTKEQADAQQQAIIDNLNQTTTTTDDAVEDNQQQTEIPIDKTFLDQAIKDAYLDGKSDIVIELIEPVVIDYKNGTK